MSHYTEDRRWSHIHKAWILADQWNDKEEIALLEAKNDATLARIAELELENAELRKDAERYRSIRWMAMQDEETQERCRQAMEAVTPDDLTLLTDEMWDAAVDTIAAIASEKDNERG